MDHSGRWFTHKVRPAVFTLQFDDWIGCACTEKKKEKNSNNNGHPCEKNKPPELLLVLPLAGFVSARALGQKMFHFLRIQREREGERTAKPELRGKKRDSRPPPSGGQQHPRRTTAHLASRRSERFRRTNTTGPAVQATRSCRRCFFIRAVFNVVLLEKIKNCSGNVAKCFALRYGMVKGCCRGNIMRSFFVSLLLDK